MKPVLIAVALLLSANLAWIIFRSGSGRTDSSPNAESRMTANDSAEVPGFTSQQKRVLEMGDVREMVAAGIPDEVARQLIAGRAYTAMRTKMDALTKGTGTTTAYWKGGAVFNSSTHQKRHRDIMAVQREYGEKLQALFGDDTMAFGGVDERLASLPREKREMLRRIEQDYGEMQAELYADMGGFPLPSDQEKLKLLEQEKQRDIVAALTPEEAREFYLRSSQTAMNIRSTYGDAIETEADYRVIFDLQKAFDDQYSVQSFYAQGNMTPQKMETRTAAERRLYEELRSALGPEKYASVMRASDHDYRMLNGLAQRLQLPAGTAAKVYESRDLYAMRSRAISENVGLSPEARREQFKVLTQQATKELQSTLGQQGAELYAQRSGWVNMIKGGTAFSTDPKDAPPGMFIQGTSVFPVRNQPSPKPATPTAAPPKSSSN